ncbi:hypothetical protein [Mycolicibacterium gadium]|uniref:Uncharacterized protein n=1 Tax=Mycolicibacterium gadium TaxID=1794 RepID=A0ABT6GQ45_MYCGU|nr:hypothetical protein [Mycolicibacterium gadium]MDG5483475.1 hypothetical protein [Mycolicibacterium gadium]
MVLVLLGRMTEWGRQFWRITSGYFTGRQSATVWAVVGFMLVRLLTDMYVVSSCGGESA